MSCKTCNQNTISTNNTSGNTNNEECKSKVNTDYTLYTVRKTDSTLKDLDCCEEIDIDIFDRFGEWIDGECLVEDNLITGFKRFDKIKVTSKETSNTYVIPIETTPYYVSSITKLSLKRSIELLNTRLIKSTDCKNEFCNEARSKTLIKSCPPGQISTEVTYTINACSIISNISVAHANSLAEYQLLAGSNNYAQCNAECITNASYCNDEIEDSRLKSNCPIGYIGLEVPVIVEANKFCSQISKEKANEQAQNYLNQIINRYVLTSSSCNYCVKAEGICNDEYSEVVSKNCEGGLVTKTITIPSGTYCINVTATRDATEAKAMANAQAVADVDRQRANVIASIVCAKQCDTQALVGNIRNVKTSSLSNTYKPVLDYTATVWNQTSQDLFETSPVTQVIKLKQDIFNSTHTNYRLEVYKNGVKIIDSVSAITDDYIALIYNINIGDVLRYVATTENTFGGEYIYEAKQLKGCPPAVENLITNTYSEGDGITGNVI